MGNFLFTVFKPFEILVGKIHAPFSDRLIKGEDFCNFQFDLLPGDIVLSRIRWHLTNLFIPGFWKHAAIICHDGNIIEATAEGVHKTSLFDFVSTKDYLCVLRLKTANRAIPSKASLQAENMIGADYDYEFESNNQAYYCSELVAAAYQLEGIELVKTDSVLGRQEIMPAAFRESFKTELIFISKSCAKMKGNI